LSQSKEGNTDHQIPLYLEFTPYAKKLCPMLLGLQYVLDDATQKMYLYKEYSSVQKDNINSVTDTHFFSKETKSTCVLKQRNSITKKLSSIILRHGKQVVTSAKL